MAACKYNFIGLVNCRATAYFKAAVGELGYVRDAGVEVIFPAVVLDAAAYVFYHFRQFVGADMRVGVYEYVLVCSKGHQLVQYFADIASF